MSGGFNNPIIGGGGSLVYPSIHSPNFNAGPPIVGWSIDKNGDAFFSGTISGQSFIINSVGIFFYNGVPATGALVASIAAQAGTDAYGNAYPAGESLGITGQSQIQFSPVAGNAFTLGSALTGVLTAAAQAFTSDINQVLPGSLGAVILGSGSSAKMATLITSPFGTTGAAIALQAKNDGGTDTAILTFGTITTPDNSTYVFTPILALTPYALVLYGTTSGTTVVTKTSGSGTIPIPVGVSNVYGECWAGAGGAANGAAGTAGGAGEYAAEPSLAVTGGGTVAYAVGTGGTGGGGAFSGNPGTDGTNTTLTGTAVTVTAHKGSGGGGVGNGGAGGTGSTNTIHHDGGKGGNSRGLGGQGGNPNGGSGGGSSGGTNSAGNPGQLATSNAGASGGAAVTGGGTGGDGGHGGSTTHTAGSDGMAPGGGGGAGGFNTTNSFCEAGGNGASGQARVTYSTGAPGVLLSIAMAAFTDQFGNSIPAGPYFNGPMGQQRMPSTAPATFPGNTVTQAALTTLASATYPANDATVGAVYELEVNGNGVWGSTQQSLQLAVVFAGNTMSTITLGANYMAAGLNFRWKARCRIICTNTGAGGTWKSEIEGHCSVTGTSLLTSGASSNNPTNSFFSCESSGSTAVDTTANQTLALQAAWNSTTGAPTLTSRVAMFKRIA